MKINKKSDLTSREIEKIYKHTPVRYQEAWLEDLPENILTKILELEDDEDKSGLFIFGKCGVGKTHILHAMNKNFMIMSYKYRQKLYEEKVTEYALNNPYSYTVSPAEIELVVKIYNSTELAVRFRSEAVLDDYQKNETLNKLLRDYRFLIIDDFCSEKYSEFIEECFYRILNKRWENKETTIITSNYSLQEIAERIGDRIASRIAGMCQILKLEGEDKRLK